MAPGWWMFGLLPVGRFNSKLHKTMDVKVRALALFLHAFFLPTVPLLPADLNTYLV
jgi:hypothetical protein